MKKRKVISDLPFDVIANILLNLPVKSLLLFKCVCKQWQSLISDAQFAKRHLIQISQKYSNINPHRLLLPTIGLLSIDYEAYNGIENGNKAIFELDYPATLGDPKSDVRLVGSCNGLVCLVVGDIFILWNPCTRESRILPKPKHDSIYWHFYFSYGLGYDFSTDDYKLIKFGSKVEVLSMKSNVWREIPYPNVFEIDDSGGIFLNGWLHWLVRDESSHAKILSFSLAEEKFEVVSLPDRVEEVHYVEVMGLVLSGDCLCLIIECEVETHKCDNECECEVQWLFEGWEVKEFGVKPSWTRLFSSSVDAGADIEYQSLQRALCYTKTGKVVIDYDGERLDLFDTNKERYENVAIPRKWFGSRPIIYSESLVSPHFDYV